MATRIRRSPAIRISRIRYTFLEDSAPSPWPVQHYRGQTLLMPSMGENSTLTQEISALGLDIGRKRIGVAGCDRLGLMASGLMTIPRQSFGQVVAVLADLVAERRVEVLVVGLPLSLAGEEGPQAKQIRRMATGLGKALDRPVVYMDERFTSLEAEELIRNQGGSPRHDKGLVDRKAAALILQRWLDERRRTEQDGIF